MIVGDPIGSSKETPRVTLSLFEGPLDLLLHLIQDQKIDISDIPISTITSQYLETLELMRDLDLTVAGEYLVMAATLMLIKSRMLLPVDPEDVNMEENDPREELTRQLQEYQLFRNAGSYLQNRYELQSLVYEHPVAEMDDLDREWILEATLLDLLKALRDVIEKHSSAPVHVVIPGVMSIREKMSDLLTFLGEQGPTLFSEYFKRCGSRQEVIVSFLAILELVKIHLITLRQRHLWAEILIAPVRDGM